MEVLEENYTQNPQPKKRPVFLLVLSILTFVWAGLGFFGALFMLVRGPRSAKAMDFDTNIILKAAEQMRDAGLDSFAKFYEKTADMNIQLNYNIYGYATLLIVGLILGILGAVMMLRGRKIGFHMYIGYSLIAMITPYLFASAEVIPLLNTIVITIFSLLFVFMYSRNLHWLK